MDVSQYSYSVRRVGTQITRFKVVKRHFIQVLSVKRILKNLLQIILEMYQEKELPISH